MRPEFHNYYEARGFNTYYLANIVFNVVKDQGMYIRGIEEILGDMKTQFLMKPFKKYTNLHEFVRCISLDIILEGLQNENGDRRFIRQFLLTFDVHCPADALENEDAFADFKRESDRFDDAIDEITEEVFHILFGDVSFLCAFNRLCANYIEQSGFGEEYTTPNGTLKRKAIPVWAKRAIFHRDKGECRSCKKSLTALINRLETECFDHIVPLARFGANDVTNLQLLCKRCNLKKSANEVAVSRMYPRAY